MLIKRFVVGLALTLALSVVAHAQDRFRARLATVPIDPRTAATTTGFGEMSAELDGDELSIAGTFEGMQGNATEAWVHVGIAMGARGPSRQQIDVTPGTSGSFSGSLTLDAGELDALRAGRFYVQIHSEAAPDGNLMGWLVVGQ